LFGSDVAGNPERASLRRARILSVGTDGTERRYLVVSGPAASGKTPVARGLADELVWPLLAKDTIKAALMSVMPVADVEDARRLGRAAMEVLLAVAAEARGGAVLEAVWRRDQGRGAVSSLPGAVVEVFCRCDRPTLEARYAARHRPSGYVPEHQDPAELWSPETFEPLAGGWSVIEVDTTGEVDPVALADKVRQATRYSTSAACGWVAHFHGGDPNPLDVDPVPLPPIGRRGERA